MPAYLALENPVATVGLGARLASRVVDKCKVCGLVMTWILEQGDYPVRAAECDVFDMWAPTGKDIARKPGPARG